MLALDSRVGRAAWTVLAVALSALLLYEIRGVVMLFVVALFLAYLLAPIVRWVGLLFPTRTPRSLALAITYLLAIGLVAGFGIIVGARIVQEARALGVHIQEFAQRSPDPRDLPLPGWLEPFRDQILTIAREQISTLSSTAAPLLLGLGSRVYSFFSGAVYIVLLPIISFFMLRDGERIRDALLGWDQLAQLPDSARTLGATLSSVDAVLKDYVRSLVILSLVTFAVYSVGFSLAGIPYAALLAAMAAAGELVPVLGPIMAMAAILIVAVISGYSYILWLLAAFAGYRLLLDYVLMPYVMSSRLDLHPLLIIFGVFAGERIGGIPGMFLAIPALACARLLLREWAERRAGSSLSPTSRS